MTLAPVTETFLWLYKFSLPVGGAIASANLIQEKHPDIQRKCNALLEWTSLTPQVSLLLNPLYIILCTRFFNDTANRGLWFKLFFVNKYLFGVIFVSEPCYPETH